jgi:hypothetical protein
MAISDRISAMYDHVGDIYDTLELGGDTTQNKNIVNINNEIKREYKDFLANGTDTLWNNWNKVNGTGESLTLNNTIKGKMKIDLKGNTFQQTYTGKNLISTNEFTLHRTNKRTIQIDFATPLPAGTYTISWKIASQSGLTSETSMGWALYNGSTNLGSLPGIYNGVTTSSSTKTTTKQITHLYAFINSSAPSDATITIENLQVELSSSPTSYEPYVGGQPSPNPDYPQDIHTVSGDNTIKVCNKNLLNPSEFAQKVIDTPYNSSNISTYDSATGELSIKMGDGSAILDGFKENTQYTIILKYNLTTSGSNLRVEYTDGTKNSLNPDLGTGIFRYVTTSGKTVDKIAHIAYDSTGTKKIYLKESGIFEGVIEATDYEPYQSQTYPINLGSIELCKIGDYQDSIVKDNGKWYLNKKIGKVVLDENTSFSNSTANENFSSFFIGKSDMVVNGTLVSNYFKQMPISGATGATKSGIASHNTLARIYLTIPTNYLPISSWLSTHNTEVYYILATPTYTEITDSTLISQLEAIKYSYNNQTNISQTNTDKPFILDVTALGELEI